MPTACNRVNFFTANFLGKFKFRDALNAQNRGTLSLLDYLCWYSKLIGLKTRISPSTSSRMIYCTPNLLIKQYHESTNNCRVNTYL